MSRSLRHAFPRLLLVLVIGLQGGLAWHWMAQNGFFQRPLISDAAFLRVDALKMMQALDESGLTGWLEAGLLHPATHPPLLPMLTGLLAYPQGGVTPTVAWLFPAFFGLLFGIGTYRLARHFGGAWFGLSVVAIVLSAPEVVASTDILYAQMPMAVLVLLSLDALLRSEGFASRRWSLAFGAWAGLAALMKMLAPLYLVGSVLAALMVGLRKQTRPRRAAGNLLLSLLPAVLLAAPWYSLHLGEMLHYTDQVVGREGQAVFSRGLPLVSLTRWIYYPRAFLEHLYGLPLGLLAALGLVAVGWRAGQGSSDPGLKTRHAKGWILAAGALLAWLILSVGQTAALAFYLVGFAPLGAIGLVAALRLVPKRRVRPAGMFLVGFLVLLNQFLASRDFEHDRPLLRLGSLTVLGSVRPELGSWARSVGARPQPAGESWPNRSFMKLILEQASTARPRVFFLSHPIFFHPYVCPASLLYEAARLHQPLATLDLARLQRLSPARQKEELRQVSFVVHDQRVQPLSRLLEDIRQEGRQAEILARVKVTSISTLNLLAMRPAYAPPRYPDLALLREPGVVRCHVAFDSGPLLVAGQSVPAGGDKVALNLFFRPGNAPFPRLKVAVVLRSGRQAQPPGSVLFPVRPRVGAALLGLTLPPVARPAAGSKPVWELELKRAGASSDKEAVPVLKSDLKLVGPSRVVLPFNE